MNLEITDEWLLSFDDKTLEPSGYITPQERADVARRRESTQTVALQTPPVQEASKMDALAVSSGR